MASSSGSWRRCLFHPLFFFAAFFLPHLLPASAQDADASKLLEGINTYRNRVVNISSLAPNSGADCMAEKILTKYEGTTCSNDTGLDTIMGLEPQFSDYPTWAASCNVPLENTKGGEILPNCVLSTLTDPVNVAVENYTLSAGKYLNDTYFVSAGVAHSNNWFVLILATNSSDGAFMQTSSTSCYLKPNPAMILLTHIIIIGLLSISVGEAILPCT